MGFINFLTEIGFTKESTVPVLCSTFIIVLILIIAYFKLDSKFSERLNKALRPIKNAIVEIQSIFTSRKIPLQYSLTETIASPVRPTEYGLVLFKESGLKKIFEDNKERLLKELDKELKKKVPFTPYDIQEKAFKLMIDYKDTEIMNPVKAYAYKQGMEVEAILRVSALFLRDEYLKKKRRRNSLTQTLL